MKLNQEDKIVKEYGDSLPFGISKVQLLMAELKTTKNDKEFIEITVSTEDGIEDSASLFFVGGAVNISFNTIRAICVHQGKTDEEKQAIRDKVDSADSTEQLVEILNEYIGGELWFTKYYDTSRTYEKNGQVKKSINKSVYGYEPKLRLDLMPKQVDKSVQEYFPEAKNISNSDAAIPENWG